MKQYNMEIFVSRNVNASKPMGQQQKSPAASSWLDTSCRIEM